MAPDFIAETFWPLIITPPEVGISIAAISFSSVLLPAPEWPVMNTISPASTVKATSRSAS